MRRQRDDLEPHVLNVIQLITRPSVWQQSHVIEAHMGCAVEGTEHCWFPIGGHVNVLSVYKEIVPENKFISTKSLPSSH